MQQQAWLSATPGKSKLSRYTRLTAEANRTGGQRSPLLDLPEVPPAVAHLVEYLFEVGPTLGEHAITFGEVESWCNLTGTVLNEFEATTLRALSRAYLGMLHQAAAPECPPPVAPPDEEPVEDKRAKISSALGAFLRAQNDPKAKAAREKKRRNRE